MQKPEHHPQQMSFSTNSPVYLPPGLSPASKSAEQLPDSFSTMENKSISAADPSYLHTSYPLEGHKDTAYRPSSYSQSQVGDEDVRQVVETFLQQWHKIVIARTINDNRLHLTNNPTVTSKALRINATTNSIFLKTMVDCETRDDQGKKSQHRFTINSTMKVGSDGMPDEGNFKVYTDTQGTNDDDDDDDEEASNYESEDSLDLSPELSPRRLPKCCTPYPRSPTILSDADDSEDDYGDYFKQPAELPRRSSVVALPKPQVCLTSFHYHLQVLQKLTKELTGNSSINYLHYK